MDTSSHQHLKKDQGCTKGHPCDGFLESFLASLATNSKGFKFKIFYLTHFYFYLIFINFFIYNLKNNLLAINGNMSSRIFGEIFCNLAKEGKKGRSVTKVLCMVKPRPWPWASSRAGLLGLCMGP